MKPGANVQDPSLRERPRAGRMPMFKAISVGLTTLMAALTGYALARIVIRLFWADGQFDFAISAALSQPGLTTILRNTVMAVGGAAIASIAIGSGLAWLNERTDARLGTFGNIVVLFPFLLPPVAGAIGWVLLLSPRAGLLNGWLRSLLAPFGMQTTDGPLNIHSWYGLIFVYTIYMVPLVFMLVSAGLRNFDTALEESSTLSKAGIGRTLSQVTLPAVMPSVVAGGLLAIWLGLAMFGVPVVIGTDAGIEVISVRIVELLRLTYPAEMSAAVGLSFFVFFALAVVWYFQQRVLRSGHFTKASGKGMKSNVMALGRLKWPARLMMIAYIFVATVLPVIALLSVALRGFWTASIEWSELSLRHVAAVVTGNPLTYKALTNSLFLAITSATIATSIAAIVAILLQRRPGRYVRFAAALMKVPAAVSVIVMSVALILAFAGPPFSLHGSLAILLIAFLVIYIPQATVSAETAAGQVGAELREASLLSNARHGRTLWRIELPLMLPGLAAGWSLVFVLVMGDLTASAMLAGIGNTVVGSRIYEYFISGSYAPLAVMAFIVTLINASVLGLIFAITGRLGRGSSSSAPNAIRGVS